MIKSKSVYIIAEAGVNHNGSIETALELIKKAKEAGADCVKFQTFKTQEIVTKSAPKANYQLKTTDNKESQYEMLAKLELKKDDFQFLKNECEKIGIDFMSTPYNLTDIDLLNDIGVKAFKVASGQLTEHYFLEYMAKKNKPVIISTGMATLSEVFDSVQVLKSHGCTPYVLQCTTNYPSMIEDSNILSMNSIKEGCNVEVGYSDHVVNNYACFAAVALGAKIIEKHFTLDKEMEGPDHSCSLNPSEFKELVHGIRQIEASLGSSIKTPTSSEVANTFAMRRGVVAVKPIAKGEVISFDMLGFKRPLKGLAPKNIDLIIGNKSLVDIDIDQHIYLNDIEIERT